MLNKRANEPPAELRVEQLSINRAEERRVSDANWAYANDSYEPPETVAQEMKSTPWSFGKPEVVPVPNRSRHTRQMSDQMSQISEMSVEPRKIGRPPSVISEDGDFYIPRAKAKKPIRTPSGRSMKATEYLREYTPRQPTLKEEVGECKNDKSLKNF